MANDKSSRRKINLKLDNNLNTKKLEFYNTIETGRLNSDVE
jgi:hypothetical protein